MKKKNKTAKQILMMAVIYFIIITVIFFIHYEVLPLKMVFIQFLAANSMHGFLYENKVLTKINSGASLILFILVLLFVK